MTVAGDSFIRAHQGHRLVALSHYSPALQGTEKKQNNKIEVKLLW